MTNNESKMLTKEFCSKYVSPTNLEHYFEYFSLIKSLNITEEDFIKGQNFFNKFGLGIRNLSDIKFVMYDEEYLLSRIIYAKENGKFTYLMKNLSNIVNIRYFPLSNTEEKSKSYSLADKIEPVVVEPKEVVSEMATMLSDFRGLNSTMSTDQYLILENCEVPFNYFISASGENIKKAESTIKDSIIYLITSGYTDVFEIVYNAFMYDGSYGNNKLSEEEKTELEKLMISYRDNIKTFVPNDSFSNNVGRR